MDQVEFEGQDGTKLTARYEVEEVDGAEVKYLVVEPEGQGAQRFSADSEMANHLRAMYPELAQLDAAPADEAPVNPTPVAEPAAPDASSGSQPDATPSTSEPAPAETPASAPEAAPAAEEPSEFERVMAVLERIAAALEQKSA